MKIKRYQSINENQFNELLDKLTLNDSKFARLVGINQSSISLKRHRGFNLSFAQAFSFYAQYYLSDSEINFIIEQMKKDGFIVEEQ